MRHKFPAFANEDAFAMCVRLRRARRITRELDDLIGTVLFAIVRLAVAINLRRADAYLEEVCRDADVQMEVVLMLLDKIDTDAKTENPHALINYLLGVAIARFKVVRRNKANRQRLRPTKMFCEISEENKRREHNTFEYHVAVCSDIDGKTIFKH